MPEPELKNLINPVIHWQAACGTTPHRAIADAIVAAFHYGMSVSVVHNGQRVHICPADIVEHYVKIMAAAPTEK